MIENTEANVKLTFEQLQQIDVTQKRLANLANEVNIASKKLNEERALCERVTKERMYQEELLADLTAKVGELKSHHFELNGHVQVSSELLVTNTQKAQEIATMSEQKLMELKEREDKLTSDERDFVEKKKEFNADFNKLSEDKVLVQSAKNVIKNAIESITL